MFYESIAQKGINSPWEGVIQNVTAGDWVLYLLTKSVICIESAWNPNAVRPEPRLGDASYGLMQILFATAQGEGYDGDPAGLFDPVTNITYGVSYLGRQLIRYGGNISDAASAYNGGHALRRSGGGYVNQSYVDSVNTYYVWYQNNQPIPAPPPDASSAEAGGGGGGPALQLEPSSGIVLSTLTGYPVVSATDLYTMEPVSLENVRMDFQTGGGVDVTTGNPVQLETQNPEGMLVPILTSGPEPFPIAAGVLVGVAVALFLLSSLLGGRRR